MMAPSAWRMRMMASSPRLLLCLIAFLVIPVVCRPSSDSSDSSPSSSSSTILPPPPITNNGDDDSSQQLEEATAFWLNKNCTYGVEDPQPHSYFWSIRLPAAPGNASDDGEVVGYLFGTIKVSANLIWDSILPEIKEKMESASMLVMETDDTGSNRYFVECFVRLFQTDPALPEPLNNRLREYFARHEVNSDWKWAFFQKFTWEQIPPQWLVPALELLFGNQEMQSLGGERMNLEQRMKQWARERRQPVGHLEKLGSHQMCPYLPSLRDQPELLNFALGHLLDELEAMESANRTTNRMGPIQRAIQRYKCGLFGMEDDLLGNENVLYSGPLNQTQLEMVNKVNPLMQLDTFTRRNERMAPMIDGMLRERAPGNVLFFAIGAGHLYGNGSLVELLAQRGYMLREELLPPSNAIKLPIDGGKEEEAILGNGKGAMPQQREQLEQGNLWAPEFRYLYLGFFVVLCLCALCVVLVMLGLRHCYKNSPWGRNDCDLSSISPKRDGDFSCATSPTSCASSGVQPQQHAKQRQVQQEQQQYGIINSPLVVASTVATPASLKHQQQLPLTSFGNQTAQPHQKVKAQPRQEKPAGSHGCGGDQINRGFTEIPIDAIDGEKEKEEMKWPEPPPHRLQASTPPPYVHEAYKKIAGSKVPKVHKAAASPPPSSAFDPNESAAEQVQEKTMVQLVHTLQINTEEPESAGDSLPAEPVGQRQEAGKGDQINLEMEQSAGEQPQQHPPTISPPPYVPQAPLKISAINIQWPHQQVAVNWSTVEGDNHRPSEEAKEMAATAQVPGELALQISEEAAQIRLDLPRQKEPAPKAPGEAEDDKSWPAEPMPATPIILTITREEEEKENGEG